MVIGSVVAPGASPSEPTTVRNPLPHSAFSVTRRNSALICSVTELLVRDVVQREGDRRDELVLAVDDADVEPAGVDDGDLETLVRSTVGPQAADEASASSSSSRADARMRAILEHPHLDPLQRFFARDPAGQELAQIRVRAGG